MFNIIKNIKETISVRYTEYVEWRILYKWWFAQPNQIELVEKYFKHRTDENDYSLPISDAKFIHRMETSTNPYKSDNKNKTK